MTLPDVKITPIKPGDFDYSYVNTEKAAEDDIQVHNTMVGMSLAGSVIVSLCSYFAITSAANAVIDFARMDGNVTPQEMIAMDLKNKFDRFSQDLAVQLNQDHDKALTKLKTQPIQTESRHQNAQTHSEWALAEAKKYNEDTAQMKSNTELTTAAGTIFFGLMLFIRNFLDIRESAAPSRKQLADIRAEKSRALKPN